MQKILVTDSRGKEIAECRTHTDFIEMWVHRPEDADESIRRISEMLSPEASIGKPSSYPANNHIVVMAFVRHHAPVLSPTAS